MGRLPRARHRPVMQGVARHGLWLGLGLGLALPAQWAMDAHPTELLALPVEWCLAVALAAWRPDHRATRPLLALTWLGLLVLELARAGGRLLTAADPQLYDLAFLAQHLWVLLLDLWGLGPVVAGALAALALLAALTVGVAALLRPGLQGPHHRRVTGAVAVLSVVLALLPGPHGGRLVLAGWPENVAASLATWRLTQQAVSTDPYAALAEVAPQHTPDVGLYVVESYGRVLSTTPSLAARWAPLLDSLEGPLTEQGWTMASGYATAPVSGGRSWISDASVFLGIAVHHQSTWAHVQPHTDRFTHLPGWLARHGYQTLVCRPKDKARHGLAIRNDFGWQHGRFADDLHYTGRPHGWGVIPDHHSLEVLHTEVLPTLPPPRFTFFHGVSAHAPWDDVPVLGAAPAPPATVPTDPTDPETDDLAIVRVQAKRYGSKVDHRNAIPGRMFPKKRDEYFTTIDYSLRATVASLADLPPTDDGHLVVIYGDHQPPFIARPGDFDVPVHVLTTRPELLQPFLDRGFRPGLQPPDGTDALPLEALYPLLARALTGDPLPAVPSGLDLARLSPPPPP